MDIVLPLLASDLERYLRLQRPTFERFYSDLATTWIITRPEDVGAVASATGRLAGVRVIDEMEVVPELPRSGWARRVIPAAGWQRQQLIKLAAVTRIDTPFALVLDADVIAVRPVTDADLIEDGRALRPVYPPTHHQNYVRRASKVLGMAPLNYTAAVTPSVLSRDAVVMLAGYVDRTVRPTRRRIRLATFVPGFRRHLIGWRGRLLGAYPWTEYQLYDTFLRGSGNFDRFHVIPSDGKLCGNAVWNLGQFADWTPAGEGSHFFSLVQDNLGIPVTDIEKKLVACRLIASVISTT